MLCRVISNFPTGLYFTGLQFCVQLFNPVALCTVQRVLTPLPGSCIGSYPKQGSELHSLTGQGETGKSLSFKMEGDADMSEYRTALHDHQDA